MGIKDGFTAEEWARVVGAPMLAGIAVTAAEPGGLWGVLKESAAVAGAMRDAGGGGQGLVSEVIAEYQTSAGREMAQGALKGEVRGKKPGEIVKSAMTELKNVTALVAQKAPQDAAGYRAWLKDVAQKVAEAGTEGGFLGFGGEKVSPTERATLDRLGEAIG